MTITDLQKKLEAAYSVDNLNKIALALINMYKTKDIAGLKRISGAITDFIEIEISADGKGFAKLISLYHPDRSSFYITEIQRLAEQNNFDGLLNLTHILKLERIDLAASSFVDYDAIDYSPVYQWDINTDGFTVYDEKKQKTKNKKQAKSKYNFYDAVKIRHYGHTNIEYPSYYLEDFDEFELSESDIDDLDGIQFCIHAKSIDLSGNQIYDISPLLNLVGVEELNLSGNTIESIDGLDNLVNLKRLYLADNPVSEISVLYNMAKLEYVDLTGTNVDKAQINALLQADINVDYYLN